ncbi:MAG: hypothetical protein HYR84_00915 [Planctomycetes bacterium]|nr:hypothetical protein [Planctomycetota bacterium]
MAETQMPGVMVIAAEMSESHPTFASEHPAGWKTLPISMSVRDSKDSKKKSQQQFGKDAIFCPASYSVFSGAFHLILFTKNEKIGKMDNLKRLEMTNLILSRSFSRSLGGTDSWSARHENRDRLVQVFGSLAFPL